MAEGITSKMKNLNVAPSQDINILLLGETGVGKSTFINAIANYLHFKSFKKASKGELLILIPSVITVTNEAMEQITIKVGASDNNEYQEIGAAGTQDAKTYVFPLGEGKTRLRLIDTPGMGDPRGLEQDDINCESILAYLSQLKELHAICFLMKPTTTRRTVFFEYCVKQILSRLEKSASKNIIFVFTNTRGTDYSPGDTLPCLRTVIEDVKSKPPNVDIPLKDNIFSLDNEAFRFLVAQKKGVTFNENVQERFVESWNNSTQQCLRMISYITGDVSRDGLRPHQLYNTISINEARRIIVQLSQPLADITQLIHDNLRILERHRDNLRVHNESLDEMKKKLFIPALSLEVTKLTQPVTVCTSTKCADLVMIENTRKWHYRQRCHDPCYLRNVTKEIVGDPNLMNCAAMSGRTCMKCTCDYAVHMHVYYLTKTVSVKIEDLHVKNNITRKEQALQESQRLIGQIDQRKNELEHERDVIIRSTAQFAHFLQHNAISPYNDAYKAYIEYLISREKSMGRHGDPEVTYNLEQLLIQYNEIKATFDKSLELSKTSDLNTVITRVTPETVMNTIQFLYRLKHNGQKIRELLTKQTESRTFEYTKSCEYIHPQNSILTQSAPKNKSKKGSKTDDEGSRKEKSKKNKNTGHATDDESRRTQPRTFTNQQFRQQRPAPAFRTNQSWPEPPPPYDDHGYPSRGHQNPNNLHKKDEQDYVVRVEVKKKPNSPSGDPLDYPYGGYPPWDPAGPYYGPPPVHYPPHGYYGPPQGYHGPPQGYHGPPQGYYAPPQRYHTPLPQGYQGYPQGHNHPGQWYQQQGQPRGGPQRQSFGNQQRGRGAVRGGNWRATSNSRQRDDKKSSKNKKLSSNLSSESSSE